MEHEFSSSTEASGMMAGTSGVNGTSEVYDFERCAREGFLFYRNEDSRSEEELPRMTVVANGSAGVTTVNGNVPLMALNATKAGMEGLDVETINKTIMEASEGSKFYEHKKKQQEKIDKKIMEIQNQLENLTQYEIVKAQGEVDKLVREIEENTDLSHYYVHLDMDAFFASVEMRDDPSLRDIPMAVGSESMLSTSNYVARRFGVRAAMPGFIARKLCPQVRIIPCNFKKYQEASRIVEATIKEYDNNLFMCMDEADLDITPLVVAATSSHIVSDTTLELMRNANAWKIVQDMRAKIEAATKLTASAGIAPTRFLAKLCSDIKKPNGQCALRNDKKAIRAFLSAMPIRKVCGIGNVTEQLLKALNIHTCKDLWEKRAILSLLFKRATFQNLLGIAMGTGSTVFRDLGSDSSGRKSLSCERTFMGTADLGFLENLCKSLCSEVEKDLQAAGLCCKTITLKIKTTEYDVKTRARSIMERTDLAEKIFESAWKLYMSYVNEIPDLTIRLMGVRVSNLEEKDGTRTQMTLDQFLKAPATSTATTFVPIASTSFSSLPSSSTESSSSSSTSFVLKQEENTYCRMACPVCNIVIQAPTVPDAERLMDMHIDECLSRTKAKEVRSEMISAPAPPKKRSAASRAANDAKKPKRGGNVGIPINFFFQKSV